MQVLVETDNNIEGRQDLTDYVESVVLDVVDRYAEQLTRVEAHLGDVNSAEKSGSNDMRCMLEARVAGRQSIAVSHQADSLHLAIDGAATKLQHALDSALGKSQDRQRRAASPGELSADVLRDADTDASAV